MKTSQIVLIAVVTSVVSAALTATIIQQVGHESAAAQPELSIDPTVERLQGLETSQLEMLSSIDILRSRFEDDGRTSATEDAELARVERLVATALEKLAADGKLQALAQSTTLETAEKAKLNIAAHALELLRDDLSDADRQALWAEAHKAGQSKELLAWFEQRAEANPTDADAQSELGSALLQMLFVMPEGPAKGQLAMRADGAFDTALAIDDQHWEARYSKAVSLSFWPPVFGKQQEAINHFETLVSQQAGQTGQPGFASTHLLLGNMYAQMGQADEAMAAWQAGADLFPDDPGLQEQLSEHQ